MKNTNANIQYSLMNAGYWMMFGVALSFGAVYLGANGYTASETGIVLAAGNILAFVLQPAAAGLIDRSERVPLPAASAALCIAAGVCFALLAVLHGRGAAIGVCYSAMLCAVLVLQPLVNSFCMYMQKRAMRVNFGIARGLGSLAYSVISLVLGVAVERVGVFTAPLAGAVIAALMAVQLAYLMRRLPKSGGGASLGGGEGGSVADFVRGNGLFCVALLGMSLVYFPHALVCNFLIRPIENAGGGAAAMGALTSFQGLLELPAMFLFAKLCRRFGSARLLRFSAIAFTAKALAFALAPSIGWMFFAGAFQAASFAVYIPASVQYAAEAVRPEDHVKGQAFVTATITLGSIIASVAGGVMYDRLGVFPTLMIGAAASAAGTLILIPAVRTSRKL